MVGAPIGGTLILGATLACIYRRWQKAKRFSNDDVDEAHPYQGAQEWSDSTDSESSSAANGKLHSWHVLGSNTPAQESSRTSASLPTYQKQLDVDDDLWIPLQDLVVREQIGIGSFGTVFRASYKGRDVALKLLPGDSTISGANSELDFLARVKHPYIVDIIGVSMHEQYIVIAQEYVEGGTLHELLHGAEGGSLRPDHAREIAHDIASAFDYLHPDIVHRDLKPQNVLLSKRGFRRVAKVCDFSIAKLKRRTFLSTMHLQAGARYDTCASSHCWNTSLNLESFAFSPMLQEPRRTW